MPEMITPPPRTALWQVVVGCVAVALMLVVAVLYPENRYPALFVVLLGAVGTWKHYQNFRAYRATQEADIRPVTEA